jgi:hypothetical protein
VQPNDKNDQQYGYAENIRIHVKKTWIFSVFEQRLSIVATGVQECALVAEMEITPIGL